MTEEMAQAIADIFFVGIVLYIGWLIVIELLASVGRWLHRNRDHPRLQPWLSWFRK